MFRVSEQQQVVDRLRAGHTSSNGTRRSNNDIFENSIAVSDAPSAAQHAMLDSPLPTNDPSMIRQIASFKNGPRRRNVAAGAGEVFRANNNHTLSPSATPASATHLPLIAPPSTAASPQRGPRSLATAPSLNMTATTSRDLVSTSALLKGDALMSHFVSLPVSNHECLVRLFTDADVPEEAERLQQIVVPGELFAAAEMRAEQSEAKFMDVFATLQRVERELMLTKSRAAHLEQEMTSAQAAMSKFRDQSTALLEVERTDKTKIRDLARVVDELKYDKVTMERRVHTAEAYVGELQQKNVGIMAKSARLRADYETVLQLNGSTNPASGSAGSPSSPVNLFSAAIAANTLHAGSPPHDAFAASTATRPTTTATTSSALSVEQRLAQKTRELAKLRLKIFVREVAASRQCLALKKIVEDTNTELASYKRRFLLRCAHSTTGDVSQSANLSRHPTHTTADGKDDDPTLLPVPPLWPTRRDSAFFAASTATASGSPDQQQQRSRSQLRINCNSQKCRMLKHAMRDRLALLENEVMSKHDVDANYRKFKTRQLESIAVSATLKQVSSTASFGDQRDMNSGGNNNNYNNTNAKEDEDLKNFESEELSASAVLRKTVNHRTTLGGMLSHLDECMRYVLSLGAEAMPEAHYAGRILHSNTMLYAASTAIVDGAASFLSGAETAVTALTALETVLFSSKSLPEARLKWAAAREQAQWVDALGAHIDTGSVAMRDSLLEMRCYAKRDRKHAAALAADEKTRSRSGGFGTDEEISEERRQRRERRRRQRRKRRKMLMQRDQLATMDGGARQHDDENDEFGAGGDFDDDGDADDDSTGSDDTGDDDDQDADSADSEDEAAVDYRTFKLAQNIFGVIREFEYEIIRQKTNGMPVRGEFRSYAGTHHASNALTEAANRFKRAVQSYPNSPEGIYRMMHDAAGKLRSVVPIIVNCCKHYRNWESVLMEGVSSNPSAAESGSKPNPKPSTIAPANLAATAIGGSPLMSPAAKQQQQDEENAAREAETEKYRQFLLSRNHPRWRILLDRMMTFTKKQQTRAYIAGGGLTGDRAKDAAKHLASSWRVGRHSNAAAAAAQDAALNANFNRDERNRTAPLPAVVRRLYPGYNTMHFGGGGAGDGADNGSPHSTGESRQTLIRKRSLRMLEKEQRVALDRGPQAAMERWLARRRQVIAAYHTIGSKQNPDESGAFSSADEANNNTNSRSNALRQQQDQQQDQQQQQRARSTSAGKDAAKKSPQPNSKSSDDDDKRVIVADAENAFNAGNTASIMDALGAIDSGTAEKVKAILAKARVGELSKILRMQLKDEQDNADRLRAEVLTLRKQVDIMQSASSATAREDTITHRLRRQVREEQDVSTAMRNELNAAKEELSHLRYQLEKANRALHRPVARVRSFVDGGVLGETGNSSSSPNVISPNQQQQQDHQEHGNHRNRTVSATASFSSTPQSRSLQLPTTAAATTITDNRNDNAIPFVDVNAAVEHAAIHDHSADVGVAVVRGHQQQQVRHQQQAIIGTMTAPVSGRVFGENPSNVLMHRWDLTLPSTARTTLANTNNNNNGASVANSHVPQMPLHRVPAPPLHAMTIAPLNAAGSATARSGGAVRQNVPASGTRRQAQQLNRNWGNGFAQWLQSRKPHA